MAKKFNLVTITEYARLAQVKSVNSIYYALKKGLREAKVGHQINVNHPAAQEYLNKRQAKIELLKLRSPDVSETNPSSPKNNSSVPKYTPTNKIPDEVKEFENMTIKEIVSQFGGMEKFKSHVQSLKMMADYKNKEIKWRQERGKLIERGFLGDEIFALLDICFKRLVTDVPFSLAKKLETIVLRGGENVRNKLIEAIKTANSQILKKSKQQIKKRLLND